MNALVTDLNVCSNKGLSERFDSTIGAATVLMPFGGKNQLTPAQAMVAKLPVGGETTTCSGMAWGFNPYLTEADQFTGAYVAVVEIGRAPGGGRLQAPGYVPDVPGVFREPARRREALGQAHGCRPGRAHGAGRPGHRLHRRQGLHVRQLRAARCAAHACVLRHGGGQGRPRDVPRVQGRRPSRGAAWPRAATTPRASRLRPRMHWRPWTPCRSSSATAPRWRFARRATAAWPSRCSRCAWATAWA